MSIQPHVHLSAALQAALSDWAVAEVSGEQARMVSVPSLAHFGAVLDRLGQPWSLGWACDAQGPYMVRARLQLAEQSREGMAQHAQWQEARRLALAEALHLFGVPLQEHWVEYTPEDGPNTAELPDLGAAASLSAPTLGGVSDVPQAAPDPQMEKARAHIDRLMESLREAGLGAQTLAIITRHGGYGKNVEESRAIYKELQALQK